MPTYYYIDRPNYGRIWGVEEGGGYKGGGGAAGGVGGREGAGLSQHGTTQRLYL